MKPIASVSIASFALMCGCLLLEERPRTDECVQESQFLGGSMDDEGEELVLPAEPTSFACLGELSERVELPGYVIELHSQNFDTEMVRAVDDRGERLPVALVSPSCDELPDCSDWTDIGAPLPIGADDRSYLVVRPAPSSTSLRLELFDGADLCPSTFDGVCDEPGACPRGTDSFDCG
ncbi:MAG: hypothetical protein ACRBN8_29030 [Nannocystales bacterium]